MNLIRNWLKNGLISFCVLIFLLLVYRECQYKADNKEGKQGAYQGDVLGCQCDDIGIKVPRGFDFIDADKEEAGEQEGDIGCSLFHLKLIQLFLEEEIEDSSCKDS